MRYLIPNRHPQRLKVLTLLTLLTTLVQSNGFYDANEKDHIFGQGSKQISDINLLLPISNCADCRKALHNISAINGCFQWEVSHPNLIELRSIQAAGYPDCANIAELQAISTKPSKSLIWISARDKYSGQVLRCEAKLGLIKRLEIQTHLRQFYVDDYEHLHIAAYDEEGNIFNSLEGLRFEWNIDQGTDIVKIVTMKEAAHKQSELQKEMEFSKMHSDVLFLKGLRTGTATLSVKIMEPGYDSVQPAFVTLTITEPFVVIPQKTVYLLPTSKFLFKLAKVSLKNHDMQFYPIQLPSRQYQWNLDDESKADIGEDGMFISRDKEGFVNIIVVDQYIANNTAEGSVKIVTPSLLDVDIVDVSQQMLDAKTFLIDDMTKSYTEQLGVTEWDSNWILVEGNYYLIKIFLFDRDKHPIQLTDNLVFNNIIDPSHFEVVKINKIKSEFIVKAKKATLKDQKLVHTSILQEIKSETPHFTYYVDQNRLRSEKEIRITLPVNIIHPTDLVLLPLIKTQDDSRNGELWQLHAEGGSGFYSWSIIDQNVATISGSGLVKSKEVGITKVIVRDNMNSKNMKAINVEVTHVWALTWLEDHLEIQKNIEEAQLSVIALDQQGRKFTNCTALMTQFEIKGEGILQSIGTNNTYEAIKEYVETHKDLLFLKQRFEDYPQALTLDQVKHIEPITQQREVLLLHNNFGICQQHRVMGTIEGLGRVKAFFSNYVTPSQPRLIESNYAEIASYFKLRTIHPSYTNFFTDLVSKHQIIQQDEHSFSKFYSDNVFDVAFGSSILWIVQGGTNFWKDIPEKYQVTESHEVADREDLDKNTLHFETVSEKATMFKYSLSCHYPGDKYKLSRPHRFQVRIVQQNIQTRHLLRPARHEIDLGVHCEPPQELKLYWVQEDPHINPSAYRHLPRHKVISGEKNHFVLVNSRHFIRTLLFDMTHHVFINHSSILTEFKSSNQTMLEVYPLKEGYDDQVHAGIYDKRRVEVFNYTGTVFIDAVSQGYIKRYLRRERGFSFTFGGSTSLDTESLALDHEVKDRMRIEVVQNVDIQPKFKSLYLAKDNTFKFQILYGSGHFSVSINNTDIADRHHIEGDRFITIYPKREGPIEIKVEDIEVPDSEIAVAEMLISDIYRLELDAPGTLIEQGSSMDMNVTAFDLYNRLFDEDQYPFMKFHIEIEITSQRERGLIATQSTTNNRVFEAKGQEPGLYHVTAVSHKHKPATSYYKPYEEQERQRVVSEVLKIEVFPLLQIHPASLLLTPLMRYTLQIVGGPSRTTTSQSYHGGSVEIRFDIENKTVAQVDVFREVTGLEVGDTKMFYEVIQLRSGSSGAERSSIVSKKTIPIRVRLVTDIEIPYNNQRNVYSGSMIKLIGVLKYHQETFTHGIAPISYQWNCSNPNILSLNFPSKQDIKQSNVFTSTLIMASKKIRDNQQNQNNVVFLTSFNSSTIYSVGGKQGEALVTLQLAIEYPDLYRYDKNCFTTKIIVRVNEKLQVEVPEYINNQEKTTHLFLMPPNSFTKIETNKRTRLRLGYSQQSVYDYSTNSYQYRDTQTPIIQLVNDEGIKTFDKYGKVTVIIEENQAFSDQVVMLNVLITDIYNMAAKDVYQALSFPLGSQMKIPIKFQNEHAHSFANNIEGIEVGIELSHPRVVSAQLDKFNQTIVMRAEGSGESNVVIYLVKHPHIYDIYRVRVSSVVKPFSPVYLHVGGQVTFKIMDQNSVEYQKQGDSKTSWSSNNPSVLDINQASGEAKGLSEGRAEILLSNHISAASIVQVSKVKHAEIDELSRKNLVVNTDEPVKDLRVRVKLYLHDQIEELTPTVQFDGITLLKQNVGIKCQSEVPSILEARGDVNDLEGFFCILNFVGQSQRQMPKSAKIAVTVYAPNPNKPQELSAAVYQEQVLSFEVPFISQIKVESSFRNGVSLNKDHRTASIKIFSNTHFGVHTENERDSDQGFDLIKFRVNKTEEESSEYFLTITVPKEITHDFTSNIVITHPTTQARTVIPVVFQGREGVTEQYQYAAKEGEGILSGLTKIFGGGGEKPPSQEQAQKTPSKVQSEENPLVHYVLVPLLILVLSGFVLSNFFNVDPVYFLTALIQFRNPFDGGGGRRDQRREHGGVPPSDRRFNDGALGRGGSIRSSELQRNLFPQQSSNFMKQSSPNFQSPYQRQYGAVNMDRMNNSAASNINQRSIFSSVAR